jgi:hypothetical protein
VNADDEERRRREEEEEEERQRQAAEAQAIGLYLAWDKEISNISFCSL